MNIGLFFLYLNVIEKEKRLALAKKQNQMFKKSPNHSFPNLFDNYAQHLSNRKLQKYEDEQSWHNVFYREITSEIDEGIFSVLYSSDIGRPNEPIRILVSMLLLKDGNDWSDEALYEACNFNILVSRALGLINLSDQVPCVATYYNFKKRLCDYEKASGINLMEELFKSLTRSQILKYQVNGKAIRMDSKLLQSNIAKVNRLQLSIEVLKKLHKSLSSAERFHLHELSQLEQVLLESLLTTTTNQYTYSLNKEQANDKLSQIGHLAYHLKCLYLGVELSTKAQKNYELLEQLLSDHFELVDTKENNDDQSDQSDQSD